MSLSLCTDMKGMRPKDDTLRDAILRGVKKNGELVIKEMRRKSVVCRAEEYRGEVNFKKRTQMVPKLNKCQIR